MLMLVAVVMGSSGAWADITPFSESYSSTSTATGWSTATSGRFTPTILSEGDNYFLSVDQGSRYNNGTTVTGNILSGKAAAGDNFTLMFDMRLSSSSGQTPVSLTLKDASGGTLFSLTATGTWATTWKINETTTQVTLPNSNKANGSNSIADVTWCSYKISYKEGNTYLTITNKSTSDVIFERALIFGGSSTGGLGDIVFVTKRYYANFAIDNIVLRAIQDGDTPSNPKYTIKYVDSDNNEIKASRLSEGPTGNPATITDADKIAFKNAEGTKKYIYVSDDASGKTVAGDGSTVVTVKFREAVTWNYEIKAVSGSTVIKALSSGTAFELDNVNYYWPTAINVDGTLYTAPAVSSAYKSSFNLDSNNKVVNVSYTPSSTITTLVFLAEGEDIFTRGTGSNADTRCSMGAGGYSSSLVGFTSLNPGRYILEASNRCSGTRTGIHNFYAGLDDNKVQILSADGNGYNATRTSDEFNEIYYNADIGA